MPLHITVVYAAVADLALELKTAGFLRLPGGYWTSQAPCIHVPLVQSLVQRAGSSIPNCVDVLSTAKRAYMGGLPAYEPGDTAEEAGERLRVDQLERKAFIDSLTERCLAWPSSNTRQEILVTIFGTCCPTMSTIDFVLLRGTAKHPTCFNANHFASSAAFGCPAREVAQVLNRLRRGGQYTLLPSETPQASDDGGASDEDAEPAAPPCQSYVMRPAFFSPPDTPPCGIQAPTGVGVPGGCAAGSFTGGGAAAAATAATAAASAAALAPIVAAVHPLTAPTDVTQGASAGGGIAACAAAAALEAVVGAPAVDNVSGSAATSLAGVDVGVLGVRIDGGGAPAGAPAVATGLNAPVAGVPASGFVAAAAAAAAAAAVETADDAVGVRTHAHLGGVVYDRARNRLTDIISSGIAAGVRLFRRVIAPLMPNARGGTGMSLLACTRELLGRIAA